MRTYRPLADRVLIRPAVHSEEMVGSIIVPEAVREKPTEGTVIAAGPDVVGCAIGDTVVYGRYSGVQVGGSEDLIIMRDDDILAVVT
jgi:chaperonin GroES